MQTHVFFQARRLTNQTCGGKPRKMTSQNENSEDRGESAPPARTDRIYSYAAYGLQIRSALQFPNLPTTRTSDAGDVSISIGRLDVPSADEEACISGPDFCVTTEGIYRFWRGVATILVRQGRQIIIDPCEGVADEVLRAAMLGAGFGTLLHQRWVLVMHGSAVMIEGSVVVFVGPREVGKSTIALALYRRGHQLVADDVTGITINGGTAALLSAYPQINCWPDALASLSYEPGELEQVQPAFEKRAFHVTGHFPTGSHPLRRVYVLTQGSDPGVEWLTRREGLIHLLRHSYCAKMFTLLEASQNLQQCARVMRTTVVGRVHTGRSPSDVIAAVEHVERAVCAPTPRTR